MIVVRKEGNEDNNNVDVDVVVVTDLFRDAEGKLMLKGRSFHNLQAAHSSWRRLYHRIDLKKLGCYEGGEGLDTRVQTWPFADVRGKCFPFHLNLKITSDPLSYVHSGATHPDHLQKWVLMRLKHTCRPNTLGPDDLSGERKKFPKGQVCKCQETWKNRKVNPDQEFHPDYFNFCASL